MKLFTTLRDEIDKLEAEVAKLQQRNINQRKQLRSYQKLWNAYCKGNPGANKRQMTLAAKQWEAVEKGSSL